MPLFYFAYGSNMSAARLLARAPSARSRGRHYLPRHLLRFHKAGHDGSAKCDAWHTGNDGDRVWGVLYQLAATDKAVLDRIEGLGAGYEIKDVTLTGTDGGIHRAFTYYATAIEAALLPFDWYLHHVLRGAREADLPADYLAALERIPTRADPDRGRAAREFALHQGEHRQ
ncbi:gamma-glutamylcyclotransferase family protein [Parahaliea mediterranea]|uniref:Gamma-glutamylcyclotransferase n=1 Tax=Parahaliea mediterranea TaxID=651086 RepID=A0A939IKF2_9GAMM|nr:gamma-glutamylcyclotransferase family protein [Parahaliea mediterranea]MBN7798689.1 gamma-glutamylcyclotransferase [Parahaliea mediterranea]